MLLGHLLKFDKGSVSLRYNPERHKNQEAMGLINVVDDSSATGSFSLPANQRERLCSQ